MVSKYSKEDLILRIDAILKFIDTSKKDVGNMTLQEFSNQDLLVRGTCFSLVQIGEQMSKLETKLKDEYPNLPWSESIKMRNLIVHVYNRVKAEPVYWTVKNDLDQLREDLISIREDLKQSL